MWCPTSTASLPGPGPRPNIFMASRASMKSIRPPVVEGGGGMGSGHLSHPPPSLSGKRRCRVQGLPVVVSALIPAAGVTCRSDLRTVFESSFLRGCVYLPLAGQIITAATIATFTEPLIHIEIGRIMTGRTEAPWSDLHRLPILLMKDRRHTMVCSTNSCDGHRVSPLYGGATYASCQFLSDTTSLIEVLDRNLWDRFYTRLFGKAALSYPFLSHRVKNAGGIFPTLRSA